MSYLWARWLPDALKKEGVKIDLVPGWESRGRYRADGKKTGTPNWDFEPNGLVTQHHTAGTSSKENPWPSKNVLIKGRADLPGPLCHLSPDHNGVVHVVAAGRANHSGVMSGAGPTKAGSDGNIVAIGIEIDTNGTQVMPRAQYVASIKSSAAVQRHYKRGANYMLAHKETSVTGKWDPGERGKTVSMTAWRRDLKECLSYPAGVWQSPQGEWSWGKVDLSSLAKGTASVNTDTVRRLQYRIKRLSSATPKELKAAVQVNGKWDAATVKCLAHWQKNVFKGGVQGGKSVGPLQAEKLFGTRFHLVP